MSQSCYDPGMDMSAQSFGYYVRIQEVDNESKIKRLNLKFLVYIILLIVCKANIILLLYCKCYIILGAFELWWKSDTVYSFPEALRMQTCILWNHGFPWFTSRSTLNSGTSWQRFKFQFWPDRWILCLGICFLHQVMLGDRTSRQNGIPQQSANLA